VYGSEKHKDNQKTVLDRSDLMGNTPLTPQSRKYEEYLFAIEDETDKNKDKPINKECRKALIDKLDSQLNRKVSKVDFKTDVLDGQTAHCTDGR
jgi:hypothetical protein